MIRLRPRNQASLATSQVFLVLCTTAALLATPAAAEEGTTRPRQASVSREAPASSNAEKRRQGEEFERVMQTIYRDLDAALAQSPAQVWMPPPAVHGVLSSLPDANSRLAGCARDFCKYVVTASTAKAAKDLAARVSVEGTIVFRYPPDEPKTAILYVVRPGANLHEPR
jgi:hypothetical protein